MGIDCRKLISYKTKLGYTFHKAFTFINMCCLCHHIIIKCFQNIFFVMSFYLVQYNDIIRPHFAHREPETEFNVWNHSKNPHSTSRLFYVYINWKENSKVIIRIIHLLFPPCCLGKITADTWRNNNVKSESKNINARLVKSVSIFITQLIEYYASINPLRPSDAYLCQ